MSDPEILDWFGRTMALPHRAGEGETAMPSAWYERCPGDDEWAALHAEVRRAGMPWADELGRFIATSARELAHWVTPSDSGGLVTSHLDLQPQNVLVGRAGPVLLDWDNAGSASTERELARALFVWSGGNEGDVEAGVRVARAYRSAGGRAVVQGPQSFSMLFATELNYVRVQAECAIDPTVTAAQREFGQRTEGGLVVAEQADELTPGGALGPWSQASNPGSTDCPGSRNPPPPDGAPVTPPDAVRPSPPWT